LNSEKAVPEKAFRPPCPSKCLCEPAEWHTLIRSKASMNAVRSAKLLSYVFSSAANSGLPIFIYLGYNPAVPAGELLASSPY
jgi:hypothetical protein